MRPLTIKLKPLDFVHSGEMAEWSYKHIKSFFEGGNKAELNKNKFFFSSREKDLNLFILDTYVES